METLWLWRCGDCSATHFPTGMTISDRGLISRDIVVCAACHKIAGAFLPVEKWTISPAIVRPSHDPDYPLELVKPWEPV